MRIDQGQRCLRICTNLITGSLDDRGEFGSQERRRTPVWRLPIRLKLKANNEGSLIGYLKRESFGFDGPYCFNCPLLRRDPLSRIGFGERRHLDTHRSFIDSDQTALAPIDRISKDVSSSASKRSIRSRSPRNNVAITAVPALPTSSEMTSGGNPST